MMGLTDVFLPVCFVAVSYVITVNVVGSDTGNHPIVNVRCKEPLVENGKISKGKKSNYSYMDVVKIRCDDHYKVLGNDELKCGKDGYWSANPPYCEEITCGKIPALVNGIISPNPEKSKIDSVAQFSCDAKFVLEGHTNLTCTINGTWTPDEMPKCKEPTRPGNAICKCYEGYIIYVQSEMTCTEDGKWYPNVFPACNPKIEVTVKVEVVTSTWIVVLAVGNVLVLVLVLIVGVIWCKTKRLNEKLANICKKSSDGSNTAGQSSGNNPAHDTSRTATYTAQETGQSSGNNPAHDTSRTATYTAQETGQSSGNNPAQDLDQSRKKQKKYRNKKNSGPSAEPLTGDAATSSV